jgi:hypothetical protein
MGIATTAYIKNTLHRRTDDPVVLRSDEAENDRSEFNGLEDLQKITDNASLVPREIPKIERNLQKGVPYSLFAREGPKQVEPPVFWGYEVLEVSVGKEIPLAQMAHRTLDCMKVKGRTVEFL